MFVPGTDTTLELQNQYSNYKNLLQQLAQKIGDVEQEAEEHK
jgi:prefoldin subunit 2